MKPQVNQALESALTGTEIRTPSLAEDMAFAAGTAALFMACGTAVPIAGSIAAAATIPLLNRMRVGGVRSIERECAVPRQVEEALERVQVARQLPDAEAWEDWLPWEELHAGAKLEVPVGLPHPRDVGFTQTRWAKDVGQLDNWVRSLSDGSRLHAHEYQDGRVTVHRDELDPAQGPGVATFHWLSETGEGQVVAASLTVGALLLVWRLVDGGL